MRCWDLVFSLFSQRAVFFLLWCGADEQYFFRLGRATTYSALLSLIAGLQDEQALET
jgi:hypothetical protein